MGDVNLKMAMPYITSYHHVTIDVISLINPGPEPQGATSTSIFNQSLTVTLYTYSRHIVTTIIIHEPRSKMASLPLRASTRSLSSRALHPALRASLAPARSLYSITSTPNQAVRNQTPRRPPTPQFTLNSLHQARPQTQTNPYTTTTNPPTADDLITEIQDLYEVAKDEFEIATDSTNSATIYAASDRESARDALNQLCAVYHAYTAKPGSTPTSEAELGVAGGETIEINAADAGEGPVVQTGVDPESVSDEVRGEVRRRVGQRVRELRSAVEVLEERAKVD